MKYGVFSIRDRAAVVFSQPFYAATEAVAIRQFVDLVNSPGNAVSLHPVDFDLYHVGYFFDGDGVFENAGPTQIAVGKDCVLKEKVSV